MAKSAGFDFRLQVSRDSGTTWENVPGEKVSSYTLGNEQVETTEKTTQAAGGARELVACGVRTCSVSASGVVVDKLDKTLFSFLCNAAWAQTVQLFRVMSGPYVVLSEGLYLISSFGRTGEHNGAELWTLSLESAGEITSLEYPPIPVVSAVVTYGFSVRRLYLTYTGPCMRVRRSSDNAEQDIGFRNGWLDESALSSFVGSGDGFVSVWYNQGAGTYAESLVGADAAAQPKIVRSGVINRLASGRPAIWCTAGNNLTAQVRSLLSQNRLGVYISTVSGMINDGQSDGRFVSYEWLSSDGRWYDKAYSKQTNNPARCSFGGRDGLQARQPEHVYLPYDLTRLTHAMSRNYIYPEVYGGTVQRTSFADGILKGQHPGTGYTAGPGTSAGLYHLPFFQGFAGNLCEHIAVSTVLPLASQEEISLNQTGAYGLPSA